MLSPFSQFFIIIFLTLISQESLSSNMFIASRLGLLSSYGDSIEWKRNEGLGMAESTTGFLGASFLYAARRWFFSCNRNHAIAVLSAKPTSAPLYNDQVNYWSYVKIIYYSHSHVIAIRWVELLVSELLNAAEPLRITKFFGRNYIRSFYIVVSSLGFQGCAGLLRLSFACSMRAARCSYK